MRVLFTRLIQNNAGLKIFSLAVVSRHENYLGGGSKVA